MGSWRLVKHKMQMLSLQSLDSSVKIYYSMYACMHACMRVLNCCSFFENMICN